jgi:hypothetical protein
MPVTYPSMVISGLFWCAGQGRAKYLLHMLKILPSTRTHIWCNWIYYCHWFMVHRLCHGRAASRTGFAHAYDMSLLCSLCTPDLIIFIHAASFSWGKWSWSAGWDYQGEILYGILNCFHLRSVFFAMTCSVIVPCRSWVLQRGKRSSAWIQTTRSSSSRKLRLIHGTR